MLRVGAHAKYRKRKNYIHKLHVGDNVVTAHEDKEQAIFSFYNSLLGTPEARRHTLNLDALYNQLIEALDAPISESEVWETIKNMPSDKSLGSDGFTG